MEIRKDFEEVSSSLERLTLYAQEFHRYNCEDWPQQKNGQDYSRIFSLPADQRILFERLYADGRDWAACMPFELSAFNNLGEFPTLFSYIKHLDDICITQIGKSEEFAQSVADKVEEFGAPYAVRMMLDIYKKQINLFRGVETTAKKMKKSKLYLDDTDENLVQSKSRNYDSVFIVHGHDNSAKETVARFVEKMGFESIIRHEQTSGGRTIIEKIEHYSDTDFGIVIYSPDDMGRKQSHDSAEQPKARQNVVFEQ